MLKVSGLLLLFSCAALVGFSRAQMLARQENQLAQLMEFIRLFTTHLKTSMAPPRDLIHRLSRQSSLANCPLVTELEHQFTVSSSFRRNIGQAVEKTGLSGTPAGEVLLSLGDEIGEKPLEHQLSALAASALSLEHELEAAREKHRKYAPLYRRLGVLGGLLLVVLLV